MNKWEVWLAELQRTLKGGVKLLPASRGLAWSQIITIPGNLIGATLRGQVRIAPDNVGAPLAAFAFTAPAYNAGINRSSVTMSLAAGIGANSTGALPADTDMDGVEEFPFDILLTISGGQEELLLGGVLPVIGRITN